MDRRRLTTYIAMALVFFLGAVEYAVILPTHYLYLEYKFSAEKYFMGIVLSAFSFMGMISSPICGYIADKTDRSKPIVMIALLFEVAGNIMYFTGVSKWMVLASRLTAGISSGSEAVIIAELSRSTILEQRTSILSIFIALRQFGILIGPAFNFFLRLFDFYLGPFHINMYTSPGMFMACLWILLEFVIIFLYHGLPPINSSKSQKHKSKIQSKDDQERESLLPPNETSNYGTISCEENFYVSGSQVNSTKVRCNSLPNISDMEFEHQIETEITTHERIPQMSDNVEYPQTHGISTFSESRANNTVSPQFNEKLHEGKETNHSDGLLEINTLHYDSKLVAPNRQTTGNTRRNGDNQTILPNDITDSKLSIESNNEDVTLIKPCIKVDDEAMPRRITVLDRLTSQSYDSDHDSVQVVLNTSNWRFYIHAFIKEEIIVLLAIQFILLFNQIALETMVTPITHEYLGWGEVGNSILYSCAAAEVILVYLAVIWASRRYQDRSMLVFGLSILSVATIFLTWAVPDSPNRSYTVNVIRFGIGVVLDMLAIPFIFVCSVSLYSKKVQPELQGLAQGIRRSVVSISAIVSPLWAGSTFRTPYLMFGVMIALNLLASVMLFLSYKTLYVMERHEPSAEQSNTNQTETQHISPDV